jgi:hypothetical protein
VVCPLFHSALGQLWFDLFTPQTFVKVTITFGIVIGLVVISGLIRKDYLEEEKQKKDGYLD